MKREINEEMLTAYVLGELSDQDKRDVEQAIDADEPTRMILEELKMAADKSTKAFEDANDSSLKLTDAQRDDVMKEAKVENAEAKSPRPERSPFDRSPVGDSPFDAGPLSGGVFDGESQGKSGPFDSGKDDNSGLYSLSNLDSLSTGDDGADDIEINPVQPGWDGESSGLIDIRSMKTGDDDLDDSGVNELLSMDGAGFASPAGSPILVAAPGGMSLKVMIGIGAMAAVFIGLLVTVVVVLSGSEGEDETAMQLAALQQQLSDMQKSGASAEDIEVLKKQLFETKETKESEEELAEGEAETKTAKGDEKSKSKSSSKSSASKKSERSVAKAKNGAEDDEEYDEPPPERAKAARSAKGRGNDALDNLLGGTMAGPKKRSSSSAKPSGAKANLDRSDVVKGMKGVSSSVRRCGQGSHGKVVLKVVIGSTGRVQSATPTGEHAGTPIGTCAARAVRKARFPRSQKNLTVTYPFKF